MAAGGGGGERGWERRRFEVAGTTVEIQQDLKGSGALRPLDDDRVWAGDSSEGGEEGQPPLILTGQDLSRVGLVVWQAGFVLADLLLRRPPFGSWHGVRLLDLGCGTGLVGILLALAGAEVTLTDQPHIAPLAEANVQANLTPGLHRARFAAHIWGQGDAAAALVPPAPAPDTAAPAFDVITAADVVYEPERYADLAATLRTLAAPHTLVFVAFKKRGLQEDSFLQLLEAGGGFAVQEVPQRQLAPEYQTGSYRVVRACRIE